MINQLETTFSTPELATLFRCSRQRVRQLVKDGRLKPVPGVVPYRFTSESVLALRRLWPRQQGAAGHLARDLRGN